jgi:hypothetical protein
MSHITKSLAQVIQKCINKRFHAGLSTDGIPGARTVAAIDNITSIPSHWLSERKLIGAIQFFCTMHGINAGTVDGYWGPSTEYGAEQLELLVRSGTVVPPWRDDEGIGGVVNGGGAPLQTQSELVKFYGDVGTNQINANSPYPLKIAWAPSKIVNRFTCHEKVAPMIERVLGRVLDHYGLEEIQTLGLDLFGGCLNVRPMRGGTRYSTHSWGMSIDWDPARNRLRWDSSRAVLAQPEYDKWWQLWEDEGWTSLGRKRDFDWMHVQYARVS